MLRTSSNIPRRESAGTKQELEHLEGLHTETESNLVEPGTKEKLEQLERILQSQTLAGSESLRGLLQYVVLNAVGEQVTHLKEYTIATEVFRRGIDFDAPVQPDPARHYAPGARRPGG